MTSRLRKGPEAHHLPEKVSERHPERTGPGPCSVPARRLPALSDIWIWIPGVVLLACGPTRNLPTPQQPIAYDHQVHTEAGLECVRCHRGAEEGVHAGMPSVQACAGCHRRAIPDHPEVRKLMLANENREPILWAKVNVIPDAAMVHFNHRAHARAGVECLTCHGDVASMSVAEPVRNVADMGWCVQCHRDNEASDDCLACHR